MRIISEYGLVTLWGWRDDHWPIMEKQIELAADNGIDFFMYCWYWRNNKGPINKEVIDKDPLHSSLNLHINAKNKNRLKYALIIANHAGAEIEGKENRGEAVEYWTQHFKDPQYVQVDGKPLSKRVIINTIKEGDYFTKNSLFIFSLVSLQTYFKLINLLIPISSRKYLSCEITKTVPL